MSFAAYIAIAAIITLFYRISPVIFTQFVKINAEHWSFRFLNYMVYAVMGCIIYAAAFPHTGLHHWLGHTTVTDYLKLGILTLALISACFYRNMLVLIIAATLIYGGLLWCF